MIEGPRLRLPRPPGAPAADFPTRWGGTVGTSLVWTAVAALIVCAVVAPRWAAVRPPKIQYQLATLPNGLRVILSEDHSTPIVHVSLVYHVGSKNERPGRTGFAHFFEHMMFKGSKNVEPESHTSIIAS